MAHGLVPEFHLHEVDSEGASSTADDKTHAANGVL